MSKLKAKETKVCREYVNTYYPDRRGYLGTCYYLVWALTSKGWFYLNTKFLNPAHAAKMEAKILGSKINTTNWSTFI